MKWTAAFCKVVVAVITRFRWSFYSFALVHGLDGLYDDQGEGSQYRDGTSGRPISGRRQRNERPMQARAWKALISLAGVLALVGIVMGQAPRQGRGARGQVRNQGGVPLKKARPEAADPLTKVAGIPGRPAPGTFRYTLRLRSFDGAPLAATYYPSKLGSSAPVVMLIHELGRSPRTLKMPSSTSRGKVLPSICKVLAMPFLAWTCVARGKTRVHNDMALNNSLRIYKQATFFLWTAITGVTSTWPNWV